MFVSLNVAYENGNWNLQDVSINMKKIHKEGAVEA